METEQRKERFVTLLNELLANCDGLKIQLAQKLHLKPSTLTRWFQGKIDPATIDLEIFVRLAQVATLSTDELTIVLGISDYRNKKTINKFKKLVEDLLSYQTQEQLAQKLRVKQGTISGWIANQSQIDPRRIAIGTIAEVAKEKDWNIERLLIYLDFKQINAEEPDLLSKIRGFIVQLSLFGQIELLTWFFEEFENRLEQFEAELKTKQDRTDINTKQKYLLHSKRILIILEQEDLTIASNYFSNLVEYLQFQAKNIKIATIPKLPQSLADIDILIFDINTADSHSIQLIEDLTFNGDIIIFADAIALPLIRDRISSAVSEIFAKPVDWSAKQIFPLFSK